jgi:ABC-type transport system involved in multi-copper enzyme maturation permease subunit
LITIAKLTVREATRRRLLLALVLLGLALVALSGWGFARVAALTTEEGLTVPQMRVIVSQLLILVMFMFSFILGMTAVFVAAPSISAEAESGVAQAIVARPIRKSDVVLGKWLGHVVVLVSYGSIGSALLISIVGLATGYLPPHPVEFAAFLSGEAIVGVTLALLLSTRLSGMTGGAIAVVLFGLAWIGGVVGSIGASFENATLVQFGTLTSLALPTDGLWRGAVFSLEPSAILLAAAQAPRGIAANPFFVSAPPPWPYLVWTIGWVAAVLALAISSFRRREL